MFKNLHPLTLFMYFIFVITIAVFSFNPVFLLISFLGGVLFMFCINGVKSIKTVFVYFVLFNIITVINPVFSHNGATILFFINDNRVTLEALIYGAVTALMIISVVAWFSCFNKVFDSEKLMYLIGRLLPKTALVFSMALNFIPRFIKDFKSINQAQKSVNQSHIKRYTGAFSAVITRAMEGAVITSDSMNARGYLLKKRTFYHRFNFTAYDSVYLIIFTALFVLSLLQRGDVTYYPYFSIGFNFSDYISLCSYFILAVLPFGYEIKEALKWKFFLSKI